MDLLMKFFEASAVAVGVPLGFHLLAKLFPFKRPVSLKERISFDVLQRKYFIWGIASLVSFIFFSVAYGFPLFRSLVWVYHQLLPQGGENRFLMLLDRGFFTAPAIFVGFLLGVISTCLLYRLLLRERDEKEKEILAFIAEKCGKEIERYDFLNADEGR